MLHISSSREPTPVFLSTCILPPRESVFLRLAASFSSSLLPIPRPFCSDLIPCHPWKKQTILSGRIAPSSQNREDELSFWSKRERCLWLLPSRWSASLPIASDRRSMGTPPTSPLKTPLLIPLQGNPLFYSSQIFSTSSFTQKNLAKTFPEFIDLCSIF